MRSWLESLKDAGPIFTLAFTGPSRAGKSTLANVLAAKLSADALPDEEAWIAGQAQSGAFRTSDDATTTCTTGIDVMAVRRRLGGVYLIFDCEGENSTSDRKLVANLLSCRHCVGLFNGDIRYHGQVLALASRLASLLIYVDTKSDTQSLEGLGKLVSSACEMLQEGRAQWPSLLFVQNLRLLKFPVDPQLYLENTFLKEQPGKDQLNVFIKVYDLDLYSLTHIVCIYRRCEKFILQIAGISVHPLTLKTFSVSIAIALLPSRSNLPTSFWPQIVLNLCRLPTRKIHC